MIELTLREETIQLLPQRAVFWKERKALIVSDIHIGKVATMQKMGMPVPEGAMQADLILLLNLIKQTQAERCIIVGDLIHAKKGVTEQVIELFNQFLLQCECKVELVFGNHDRSLIKQMPSTWSLECHHDHLTIPPFAFSHIPQEMENTFVWSGHIHPQYILTAGKERLALRCFHISEHIGILPAFSSFVGAASVKKEKSDRIFVTTGQEVIEV